MRISGNDTLSRLGNLYKDNGLAIDLLEKIILDRETALEEYVRKQGSEASEAYLKHENKHHLALRNVYNELYQFDFQAIWMELEEVIHRLYKHDSNLTGITIVFRTNPGPCNFAYINYDFTNYAESIQTN